MSVNNRISASPVMSEAMSAAAAIWDGIEGLISEGGSPGRYWKKSVERRYKALRRSGATPMEMVGLLDDLVDGLEGFNSEEGYLGMYWSDDALVRGRRALDGLLGAIRGKTAGNMAEFLVEATRYPDDSVETTLSVHGQAVISAEGPVRSDKTYEECFDAVRKILERASRKRRV